MLTLVLPDLLPAEWVNFISISSMPVHEPVLYNVTAAFDCNIVSFLASLIW